MAGASSPGPSPGGEAWYTLFVHVHNIPTFQGIRKNNKCLPYISLRFRTMYVRFTQVKERAPDDSRFAKALSCAASVVKADCVQGRVATSYDR